MSGSSVENARNPEQIARMEKLKAEGRCFFCDNNYVWVGASRAIFETTYWYVKKNDYPYEDTLHHYLLVPKSHATRLTQLEAEEFVDFSRALARLETYVNAPGYGLFLRQGDMEHTGATFEHLHFQYVSGGPKPADWTRENAGEKCLPITLGYRKE